VSLNNKGVLKMKYGIVTLLWLVMAGCAASAQSYKVYNLFAYSHIYTPGNISTEDAQDENAGKHKYIYTAYMESNSRQLPQITAAWIKNKSYTATAFIVPDNKVQAGIAEKNGNPIILKSSKGNFLYKIEFEPTDTNLKMPTGYQGKSAGKILLHVQINGKITPVLSRTIEMLQSEQMY
jgi:hypothetical protein